MCLLSDLFVFTCLGFRPLGLSIPLFPCGTFGFWIVDKALKAIDEVSPIERVTTNANTSALAHTCNGGLVNGLVCKGA